MKIFLTCSNSKPTFTFVPPRAMLSFSHFSSPQVCEAVSTTPAHAITPGIKWILYSNTTSQGLALIYTPEKSKGILMSTVVTRVKTVGFFWIFTAAFSTCQITQMLQCYILCGSDSLQNNSLLLSPFLTLFNNCLFKKSACVILKQRQIHKGRNLLCPGRLVVAMMGMRRREQRGFRAA